MKVIRPTVIGSAQFVTANLSENDYPQWASGTTYAAAARVIRFTTHRIYESVAGGNLNHVPENSPNLWLDIGPTNLWAMLDQAVGTATHGTGSIDVILEPGAIDTVAVLDTDAEYIQVVQRTGTTILYDRTMTLNVSGYVIMDWYAYFFTDIGRLETALFESIPLVAASTINIIAYATGSMEPIRIGTAIVGRKIELGLTEAGPSIGITDFSRKEADAFGVTTVVERPWSKRMTTRAMVETSAADGIQRALASLRAKPALWIGENGFDSLTVFGFFKDFSIDLQLANNSYISLTIEGLT